MNPVIIGAVVLGAGLLIRRKAPAQETTVAKYTRAQLEELARSTAIRYQLDPAILLATVDTESDWHVNAYVGTGGDGARGGAYGLTQMTLLTAQSVDGWLSSDWSRREGGRRPEHLFDPALNLELAAALHSENADRSTSPVGSEDWVMDLAAMYNSGKVFAKAPVSTRTRHVPRFMRHYHSRKAEVA